MSSLDTRLPIEHLRNANPAWIRKDMGDLDALAKSMGGGGKSGGQLMPVVVDQQYRVLDGARRIEAATKLGWREIHVLCTSDFELIATTLEAARANAIPMAWLEKMELIEVLRDTYLPVARQQAANTKRLGLPAPRQRDSGIALVLPRAIGMRKNLIDELSRGWSMINDIGRYSPAARERMRATVPKVEATGKIYGLIAALKRVANQPAPKVSSKNVIKEQRLSFAGAIAGLNGAALALPSPEDLDPGHVREELIAWDKAITDVLQRMYTIRKEIRNQCKQTDTEE